PGKPNLVGVTSDIYLTPGNYQIQLNDQGSQSVFARIVLRTPSISPESILENGIRQGPGLSLRLIAPVVRGPPPAPASASTPPLAPIPSSTTAALTVSSAATPSLSPSPLFVTATAAHPAPPIVVTVLGGDLHGRPSIDTNHPATVALGRPC